jgi:hypothetical protein
MAFKIEDDKGFQASTANGPADVFTPSAYTISLPYDGRVDFRISVKGYVVTNTTPIRVYQLPTGAWVAPANKPSKVSATYTVPKQRGASPQTWFGTLEIPAALVGKG